MTTCDTVQTTPAVATMPEVLTVDQVASWFQWHPVTVRRYARLGLIPSKRVAVEYRFSRRLLQAWLETPPTRPTTKRRH